ncbi:glycosyltransferase [Bacillus cereus group sp. TH43LC]|uniref:glycosyltransferase n=1 Tax=Bacillus cereus group TaxID=86661 RepID=UPI0022DEF1F4|nr:glycosyltransferase [Bacillus cereus group sp. TH43LC]MDA1502288.1 glycosyltransferase [Bacillus cereus group sp. TH43LC]
MKICHVINSLRTGGAEKLVVNLSREMINLGHEVTIVTLFQENGVPFELAKQYGIKVVNIGTGKWDAKLSFKLIRILKNFDVVHAHLFPATYYVSLLPIKAKKVMTEHSTHNKRREKKIFRFIEKIIYRRFKKVFCISNGTKKALNAWQKNLNESTDIKVIYNGIEEGLISNTSSNELNEVKPIKNLVCVASLTKQKNHKLLIEAMQYTNGMNLYLVGDGPMRREIEELIRKYNLDEKIHLLGIQSDIKGILSSADVFVLSSIWEGFGLVLIEAMAVGIPVIASDIDGINEIVINKKNGLLFNNQSATDLVISLNLLNEDNILRKSIISEGYKTANKFTVRNTVKKLLLEYEIS